MGPAIALTLALFGAAQTETETATEAAVDYTYRECRIGDYRLDDDRTRVTRIQVNCGRKQKVYLGSTGLVFLGSAPKEFVEADGKRVRFLVDDLEDDSAWARVFQGEPTVELLQANRRSLLRVKK